MFGSRIKRIIMPCIISIVIGVILYVVAINNNNTLVWYNIQIWMDAAEWNTLIFPLFLTIPICLIIGMEKKNNFNTYLAIRDSKKIYIRTTFGCSLLMGFLVLFLISFISLIYCLYCMPKVQNESDFPSYTRDLYICFDLMIKNPILYGLIISIWRGIVGVLITLLGVFSAIYIKNKVVSMMLPWIFVVVSSYIIQNVQGNIRYDIFNCYDLHTSMAECYNVSSFIGCTGIIIIFDLILFIYGKYVKGIDFLEL